MSTVPTPLALKNEIVKFLEDHKALDILTVDLEGRTTIADYLVIASGTSQRQLSATAELMREHFKSMGVKPIFIEGVSQCDWVLIDAGDVIVHLFRPEVREFYNIEKIWDLDTHVAETSSL